MNESNRFDITCQRFGRLTALRIVEGIDSKATWECRCDCGKMKNVSYHNLVQGRTKSCGCSRSLSLAKDLSGRRFGRLTAIEPTGEKKNHCFLWRCRCDCGKEVVVTSNALLMGNTRSCGCLSRDLKMENYKICAASALEDWLLWSQPTNAGEDLSFGAVSAIAARSAITKKVCFSKGK